MIRNRDILKMQHDSTSSYDRDVTVCAKDTWKAAANAPHYKDSQP
ncbi:MAG: hypothetical protein ACRDHZ_10130 [Ktedonobacteraceae bacterium]